MDPSGVHTPGNESVYFVSLFTLYCVILGKLFNLLKWAEHIPLWYLASRKRWMNVDGYYLSSAFNSHRRLAQSHKVTGVSESSGWAKCLYLEFLVFYLVWGCILLLAFLKFLIKAP